jgi:F0F1-type ATP synthase membrane subunit b/b'
MQATAWVSGEDFNAALDAARSVGIGGDLPGLAAPLSAAITGRLSNAWDHIELALQQAWTKGRDLAQDAVDAAVAKAQETVDAAGAGARAVHDRLLERLHTYLADLIERALARVSTSITIAGREMTLAGVELAQAITLTGALKLSVQEACALTAEGQVVITARYEGSHA